MWSGRVEICDCELAVVWSECLLVLIAVVKRCIPNPREGDIKQVLDILNKLGEQMTENNLMKSIKQIKLIEQGEQVLGHFSLDVS